MYSFRGGQANLKRKCANALAHSLLQIRKVRSTSPQIADPKIFVTTVICKSQIRNITQNSPKSRLLKRFLYIN
jgi:hypothetical protein